MMGHRQFGWDDYLAIGRRRRFLIIVPAILGAVILFGLSLRLPGRYESDTLVLIQSQKIPNNMVQSITTEDLNARVASLEEQVLSRTRLQSLIKRYGLFKENSGGQLPELLVDQLRKDIELTPVKSIVKSRDQTLPGFSIGVTLSSAQLAQRVCGDVTSMFIEENLRQREQSAKGMMNFFQTELSDSKRQLDEQEAKLAEFERQYIHELPEDTQTNLNLLASLGGQLEAATQALSRAQQDKTYTESLLAQQAAAWKAGQGEADQAQPPTLEQQLAFLQSQVVALEIHDTPEHPDVIKLKDEIERVKKQRLDPGTKLDTPTPAKGQHPAPIEPPQLQQLRSQLHAYEEAIRAASTTQQRLQGQIELLQSRVQMSPAVEQQYHQITRDHQRAMDFYNDTVKKTNESEMAADLEQRQQGEQFVIMDPPNLPKEPKFPNRPLFAFGGLGGGLGLGLVLVWLTEARDKAIWNEKDIEACLGLPTLAAVPALTAAPAEKQFQEGEAGKLEMAEGHFARI
jgi:polysaccharide chain length determinant protein (PEP-CTERM system associated)